MFWGWGIGEKAIAPSTSPWQTTQPPEPSGASKAFSEWLLLLSDMHASVLHVFSCLVSFDWQMISHRPDGPQFVYPFASGLHLGGLALLI